MALKTNFFQQAILYKYRFFIGYAFLTAVIALVMAIDLGSLPAGVSQAAMSTAVESSSVGRLDSLGWVVNAPFHGLQALSMHLFGISRLSLVLPSLIFGLATIILFMNTVRHWFRESIAVGATILAVTISAFIGMMRGATPEIMLPFWTMLLLFAAAKLLMKQRKALGWKILIVFAAAGLLYTPFGVYPLVVLTVAGLLHPHVRSRIRKISLPRRAILALIGLVLVAPLVYVIVREPATLNQLLGLDQMSATLHDPASSGRTLFTMYGNFLHSGFAQLIVVPVFNIVTFCLILLGLFRAVREHHTARSYALLLWVGVAVVVTVLAPYSVESVMIPAMLLLALGVDTLIRSWYQLFPRNPYARIAGILPLTVLFIMLVSTSLAHYFYSQQYISTPLYHNSLASVQDSLRLEGGHNVTLVTIEETRAFYTLLQRWHPKLTITTTPPKQVNEPVLVIPSAGPAYPGTAPSRILTSARQTDGVTLRVYRPTGD